MQALPLHVAPMAPGTAHFSHPEALLEAENLHPFLTEHSEVHPVFPPTSLIVGESAVRETLSPGEGVALSGNQELTSVSTHWPPARERDIWGPAR